MTVNGSYLSLSNKRQNKKKPYKYISSQELFLNRESILNRIVIPRIDTNQIEGFQKIPIPSCHPSLLIIPVLNPKHAEFYTGILFGNLIVVEQLFSIVLN